MTETRPKLLNLHAEDNVLVALGAVAPGISTTADGQEIEVRATVSLGHKIARRDIAKGELILKYGVPIGQATSDISAGAHVHVHNMKSNYTATQFLDQTAGGDLNA